MKSLSQEIREMLLNKDVFHDDKYNTIDWYYNKIVDNYHIDQTRKRYIKDILRKILGKEWIGVPKGIERVKSYGK